MIYFTADEHFGHTNIIKYCNRPFNNAEEMDEQLIKNHNEVVGTDDTVYHVGDFTLKNKEYADKIINRLTGKHIFLMGSHDNWNKELPYVIELSVDEIYVVMCHYAMRVWPRSHYDSVMLYGHSHGKLPPQKNSHDVGVDNNNYYPVTLKQIMTKMI